MGAPIIGEAYDFFIPLFDFGTGEFLKSPTIVSGDFKISKDGAAFADLMTTPVVMPTASGSIRVALLFL